MQILNILDILPVQNKKDLYYSSITADECHIYLLSPEYPLVSCFTPCMTFIKNYMLDRIYYQFCFDTHDHCFWALSKEQKNRVYKLDKNFCEIDSIKVHFDSANCEFVKSISFCENRNSLILNYGHFAIVYNKYTAVETERILQQKTKMNALLSIDQFFICIPDTGCSSIISGYQGDGSLALHCILPTGFQPLDITKDSYYCSREKYGLIYILAWKEGCYGYVFKCLIEEKSICRCTENCEIETCCHCQDKRPDHTCGLNCKSEKEINKYEHCNFIYHGCKCCHDDHKKCCHHHKGNKPCAADAEKSCHDIIESVALIETSISHILNAEGEKLQRIISEAETTSEILEFNKSVKDTITKITHLEHVLYNKLDLITNICGDFNREKTDTPEKY